MPRPDWGCWLALLRLKKIMQTWSISYSADKHKNNNKKWLLGTMNYNKNTKAAHFYNEEGELLGHLRSCQAEVIVPDGLVELKKFLVEIGHLLEEEESVDDLFARLNEELGIESKSLSANSNGLLPSSSSHPPISTVNANAKRAQPTQVAVSKVPTVLDEADAKACITCDFLYTRDRHKKAKVWHDGILKFYPTRKLGEFWDEAGNLLHKKVMDEIKSGELFETSNFLFEIIADTLPTDNVTDNDNGKEKENQDTMKVQSKSKLTVPPKLAPKTAAKPTPTQSAAGEEKRSFDMIYTADKHKKNNKRWIDGRVEWAQATGNAVFFTEDGNCFYKRIFPPGQIEVDAEFESGQYLFQIGVERAAGKGRDADADGDADTDKDTCFEPTPRKRPTSFNRRLLIQSTSKKPKVPESTMASQSVPLTGRSDSEIFSLLLSTSTSTLSNTTKTELEE